MRIALYGHGAMGRHHARHLAAHDLIILDPAMGPAHDPSTIDTSLIDAAVIAVPTVSHAKVALPLLERGVPCLIEKPIAATIEEARLLASLPDVMVGHIERFNPTFQLIAGQQARFVQAERLTPFLARSTDVDVVLDLMIHDLDLFLCLAPDDPVVDIRANGVAIKTGRLDIVHARIETASGRVGTFTASRVSRQPVRRFRVMTPGEYWSLDLKDRRAHLVRWGEAALEEEPVPVPEGDALAAELTAFLAAVRGELPYPITGADGLRALELAMAVRAAVRG